MLRLRDYQEEGVGRIRESYRQGKDAPLFVLPTGGGKTVIFTYITASTLAKGKRVLVLVHRIELLKQTSKALLKFDVDHGLINPNFSPSYYKKAQVASVQTVVNRLDKIPPPDLIIVDEAHHATASTWTKIIKRFPLAKILGVTATPIRGDGKGLGVNSGGHFDDLIVGQQIGELIDRGFLVRPRVFAPAEKLDLSGVRIVRGDYDKKQVAEKVDKREIIGSVVNHYMKYAEGQAGVVFCVNVAHAEHMAEQFRAAGYNAYSVDGSMDERDRNRILEGLGKSVDVVTSCDLISEGTDIPAIGVAMLCRPTQSTGLYIQQIGRALRLSEGKSEAIILDHVGNVMQHGMPDEERFWSLDGDPTKKRRKKNAEPSEAPPVSQCPSCYAVHKKALECPNCGHVYQVKNKDLREKAGELTELGDREREMIRRRKRQEVGKAKDLADLQRIEKERGYKAGWAQHVFRSRQAKQNRT